MWMLISQKCIPGLELRLQGMTVEGISSTLYNQNLSSWWTDRSGFGETDPKEIPALQIRNVLDCHWKIMILDFEHDLQIYAHCNRIYSLVGELESN